MNKEKEYEKELKKETDMFLSVCNREDARALILYKEKDGTEDIARIATLTIVFGFRKLFFKIMAKMSQESANECIARITEVMNDFETINKWVTEFISKSMSEEFSKNMLPYWEEYAKGVDRATFSLSDYFKVGKEKFRFEYLIK